jgi:glutamate dehydrogenase
MALDRALANLMRALRDLAADVLVAGSVDDFVAQRSVALARSVAAVKELTEGGITVSRLSVAAGLLTDLAREA